MENGEADDSTDEFKVVEMLRVDAGVRVDLKGVVVVCGILKQAVEWIEHFVGEKKKEFATNIVSYAATFSTLIKSTYRERPP